MVVAELFAAPPLVVDKASMEVLTLIAPLLVLMVAPLPPAPDEERVPAPLMVLPAALLVFKVMPPLADTLPVTLMLSLSESEKEPLPLVTEVMTTALPD
jgi:hypothetical protein